MRLFHCTPFSFHCFDRVLFYVLRISLSVHSTCTLFLFHPPFIAFPLCLSYSFRVLFRALQSNPTTDSPIFPHHPLSPYHVVMLPASTGLNVFFINSTFIFALQIFLLSSGFQLQLFVSSPASRSPFVLYFFPPLATLADSI